MSQNLAPINASQSLAVAETSAIPGLFAASGEKASFRYTEFFTANIRNKNTRVAYAHATRRFSRWCQSRGFRLKQLNAIHVAAYIEELGRSLAKPTVKQHLAAIRMLFDYLVTGQIVRHNPAASVRGPKYVIHKGKTPVLTRDEMRELFDSIVPPDKDAPDWKPPTIADLRDRALIGIMAYSFARVGAVLGMNVEDYYAVGKRWSIRLQEKGGKAHEVPVHHNAEQYLDAYLEAAGIANAIGTPLFRSINPYRQITDKPLVPRDALAMIKRRARRAGLGERICCHTFRATGITAYLENKGTIEKAQQIAAHTSPRTTKLYDRTNDCLTLGEIEKIIF